MTLVTVNGHEYKVHVGYWIQPFFVYIARLNVAATLDDVIKNSNELENTITKVIETALSGASFMQEDKILLFNEIARIYNEDVKNIKKKIGITT